MKVRKKGKSKTQTADFQIDTFSEEHPYPILQLSLEGRILYANPASLPVLLEWEIERGEVVNGQIIKIINEILSENIAKKVEIQNGQTWIELTFSQSHKGKFVNVFGQDVTTQKLIQQELIESRKFAFEARDLAEEARKSLEKAELMGRYGSWEWRVKDRAFYGSKGFFHILQVSETSNFNYELFINAIHKDERNAFLSAMEEAIISKQPFSLTYKVMLKGDAVHWFKTEGNPVCDESGKIHKIVGTAQDVTEKMIDQSVLMEAKIKADSATKAKAEFLANMSHEIRTPMNGVIGMCNLLLDTVTDPAQVSQLKIIQSCGNSLLNLINDILDFSKIEAGKVELENEPFNIHDTTQEVVQLLNTRASEKGVLLAYKPDSSVPAWVLGDTTRFRQVLTNLVSNAVKFTKDGSVTISSKATRLKNGRYEIRFSIQDTGIGISEKEKARLFNSFSQADVSTTRKYGGTGLGLVICKGLCEKMGGTIGFESEAGRGSTFFFTMHLSETVPGENVAPLNTNKVIDIEMAKKHPLNLLLAEDNRVNQLVVVGLLEKLGYRPDVAANGYEVLNTIKTKKYDVIFMDLHMPEMDGIEATKKIHEKYPISQRPIIVALTASAMKEDVARCLAAGMAEFISKPVQLSELNKVLKKIIEENKKEVKK